MNRTEGVDAIQNVGDNALAANPGQAPLPALRPARKSRVKCTEGLHGRRQWKPTALYKGGGAPFRRCSGPLPAPAT